MTPHLLHPNFEDVPIAPDGPRWGQPPEQSLSYSPLNCFGRIPTYVITVLERHGQTDGRSIKLIAVKQFQQWRQIGTKTFQNEQASAILHGVRTHEMQELPVCSSFLHAMLSRARLCPSILYICLSVTFRYRDYTGWNALKITSQPNNLRLMRRLSPTWVTRCNGNTIKLGWNRDGVTQDHKNPQYPQNGRTYDQGYYDRLTGSCICAFDWYQNQWPWWPWTAYPENAQTDVTRSIQTQAH